MRLGGTVSDHFPATLSSIAILTQERLPFLFLIFNAGTSMIILKPRLNFDFFGRRRNYKRKRCASDSLPVTDLFQNIDTTSSSNHYCFFSLDSWSCDAEGLQGALTHPHRFKPEGKRILVSRVLTILGFHFLPGIMFFHKETHYYFESNPLMTMLSAELVPQFIESYEKNRSEKMQWTGSYQNAKCVLFQNLDIDS